MVGFPKSLQTREDFEYCMQNFDMSVWLPKLKALLFAARDWVTVCELDDPSLGEEIEGLKRILIDDGNAGENMDGVAETGNIRYWQQEFQVLPHCQLIEIGFTVDEVGELIKNCETVLTARATRAAKAEEEAEGKDKEEAEN